MFTRAEVMRVADAQREACEAYIKSHAHEDWRLVRARYDDGGLSGASLDRPEDTRRLTCSLSTMRVAWRRSSRDWDRLEINPN
jgi:hypothetical protein